MRFLPEDHPRIEYSWIQYHLSICSGEPKNDFRKIAKLNDGFFKFPQDNKANNPENMS